MKRFILILFCITTSVFADTYKHRVFEVPGIVRSQLLQEMQNHLDAHPEQELVHFQLDNGRALVFVTKEKLEDKTTNKNQK